MGISDLRTENFLECWNIDHAIKPKLIKFEPKYLAHLIVV